MFRKKITLQEVLRIKICTKISREVIHKMVSLNFSKIISSRTSEMVDRDIIKDITISIAITRINQFNNQSIETSKCTVCREYLCRHPLSIFSRLIHKEFQFRSKYSSHKTRCLVNSTTRQYQSIMLWQISTQHTNKQLEVQSLSLYQDW